MKIIGNLTLCVVFCSALAWGQQVGANVNESLETVFITVDANTGSNFSPCATGSTFKTINVAASCALSQNAAGFGTRVTIDAGTYRETITLTPTQQTALPITFEAATGAKAVISGADVYKGWTVYSGNPQIYTKTWNYKWGLCPGDGSGNLQQDIILRREMVIVNGTVMTQVLALGEMQPGTFYVDETGGTVYLWPPTGTNISTATVEVATDHNPPMMGSLSGLFTDTGENNLVLRGLTFKYDNSCEGGTAVRFVNASNVLVDTDSFNWNNAGGLNFDSGSINVTAQNSKANHNGQLGMNSTKTKFGLWQNNETSYNNWRGAQGAYYTWGNGGFHFYQAHNDTVSGLTALYNQTHGVHFDYDSSNITASSILSSGNLPASLLIEKSGGEGPLTITNSSFCDGNAPAGSVIVNGVSVNNSEQVSLTNDIIYNGGNQFTIAGVAGGFTVQNWENPSQTFDLFTQNLTLMQDTLAGVGASQNVFYDPLGLTDWTNFTSTLSSDNNTWWNTGGNTNVFGVPTTMPLTFLNLAGWQALPWGTPADVHSVFQAPSVDPATACQATADAADYWQAASAGSVTVHSTVPAVFTATATSIGGFSGTVNLSDDLVQNIPGATASWSPNFITSPGSAAFTVNTTSSTPPGNYPIVLIANSGSVTRTSTVELVINNTVSVSPLSLSFPNTPTGMKSTAQTITLTNNGTTLLTGISVTFTAGPDDGDFTFTSHCATSLGAGQSCTVTVQFNPNTTGLLTATLNIFDSDPTSPQSVSLSGTGTMPAAQVLPLNLIFGNQLINTSSAPQVVTVTNTGNATLNITSVTINSPFSKTQTCGTTLAPGASCTISVTFKPTQAISYNGTLSIQDNAVPNFVNVPLSGTGAQPIAALTPSILNFGSQTVGTTSAPMNATLTNTGNWALSITSVSINQTYYSISSNNCGSSLGIGLSCTIGITFSPKIKGTLDATLTVKDNDHGKATGQQSVSLQGSGS